MVERVETVIIGAGQAGLATSYWLTQCRRSHVVLEQAPHIAASWRKRWNSFTTLSPNWSLTLPGFPYTGDDPDGFLSRDQLVDHFERYARSFDAPVRFDTPVSSLQRPSGEGYIVASAGQTVWHAKNVVVATGGFQRPSIPPLAAAVPDKIFQIHTDEYQAPAQLPDGGVLIVGSGASGCQIADDLRRDGRDVDLCVGRCRWTRRRYYGKDIVWWLNRLGVFDQTVDSLSSSANRTECRNTLSGRDGGRDLNAYTLARDGVVLLGHLKTINGTRASLATDLRESLSFGDAHAMQVERDVTEWARKENTTEPLGPSLADPIPRLDTEDVSVLDVDRAGIHTIVWATGYRLDFSWIRLLLFDAQGYPRHTRGVTEYPGLFFVGLRWLYKRRSSFIGGVGDDAEHIVQFISEEPGRRINPRFAEISRPLGAQR
jgi:putative flavoprotein involved in K+ transport